MHSTFKMAGWLNQSRPTIGQKHLRKKGVESLFAKAWTYSTAVIAAQSMTGPGIGREAETVSGS